jgi:predicted enzyme related to lactoylglutathione lyase
MSKHKVVHFEIPASDKKKSREFYEAVFGWKFDSAGGGEDEYLMAMTTESKDGMPTETGGINGGFYKRTSKKETPSIVIETDSIEESLKKIGASGGKMTSPKHAIGEYGFIAEFTDPDGNELSLWETTGKM